MNALVLPALVPFVGAAACLAAGLAPRAQQMVGGAVSHGLLLMSAWLLLGQGTGEIATLHFGAWDAGLGIVFVLDSFSALMLALAALAYVATWWMSLASFPAPRGQRPFFQPLLMLVAAGVNWTFLTGDLFNLFVGFEVVLLGSYVLMIAPGKAASLREGYRFLLANGVAGTMFLLSAGLVYGAYGTLNLAELSWRVASEGAPNGALFGAMLLVVFGMKAAVFPLFTWLPGAYPSMPMSALPFLTAMLTKIGVYALYRVYPLVFLGAAPSWFQDLLLWLAAATMILGALAALGQWSMREILSVHIASQIGYMIFGLALLTPIGLAGGILAIAHNIVVKTALFATAAAVLAALGTDRLKELGGLMPRLPLAAAFFFLAAISLAGLPPFSGFYAKWFLALEGIEQERWGPTAAAILAGLLTLASMVKIWMAAFWGESGLPAPKPSRRQFGATAVAGGLVAASLLFVAASGPIAAYAERAAKQLLDASSYRAAVLGDAAPEGRQEAGQ